ncbi:MAG: cation:proton antiporter [Sedimentisphaerales bacterium]
MVEIMLNSSLIANSGPNGHLNLLLLLGIAVFGGTIGARLFQKLHIPQVVGYVIVGVLIGQSVFKLITVETIESLTPFSIFALGIIGFMIGGELRYEVFKKYGWQFLTIMLSEGLFSFVLVTLATTFIAILLGRNWHISLALGVVLGAISSATAPAATVDVLWEYKTRGILTRTILAIVALDDGLSLLLYGFASSFAGVLLGSGQADWAESVLAPLWEIFGAMGLGIAAGLLLIFVLRYVGETGQVLVFSIASVTLVVGLSIALKVESILAAMLLGATLANLLPRRSQSIFEIVEKFSPPIYVLFFVLVGARLELSAAPLWMIVLAIVYVLGRSIGKISGCWFGALISKSPSTLQKYLGICLFSQAGVAIGLSILASHRFGDSIGQAIILIITLTTFLVQIVGPPMVKLAVAKAGEIGMNITEEDLIKTYKVAEVMNTDAPVISPGMSLGDVVKLVSGTDSFYYPVVDKSYKLIGAITLGGIRNTFATQELNDWLVALDIMEPIITAITPDIALSEAFERARRLDIEYIPVVDSGQQGRFVGLLDCRAIRRQLSAEVLSRQQKADNINSG